MKLFIDTEFNDFQGELISIALVDENKDYFYGSLGCADPSPWVAEHVMPIIKKDPITRIELQLAMHLFLSGYDSIHIVADWPEDIRHFCDLLITGPGMRIDTPPLTMEVLRVDTVSELPHNALCDAMALQLEIMKDKK